MQSLHDQIDRLKAKGVVYKNKQDAVYVKQVKALAKQKKAYDEQLAKDEVTAINTLVNDQYEQAIFRLITLLEYNDKKSLLHAEALGVLQAVLDQLNSDNKTPLNANSVKLNDASLQQRKVFYIEVLNAVYASTVAPTDIAKLEHVGKLAIKAKGSDALFDKEVAATLVTFLSAALAIGSAAILLFTSISGPAAIVCIVGYFVGFALFELSDAYSNHLVSQSPELNKLKCPLIESKLSLFSQAALKVAKPKPSVGVEKQFARMHA